GPDYSGGQHRRPRTARDHHDPGRLAFPDPAGRLLAFPALTRRPPPSTTGYRRLAIDCSYSVPPTPIAGPCGSTRLSHLTRRGIRQLNRQVNARTLVPTPTGRPDQPAHVPTARLHLWRPNAVVMRKRPTRRKTPMRTRHRTAAIGAALATAAAMMLTACGGASGASETDSAASGEPRTGGTLVYLDKGTYDTLYPPEAGFYPNGGLVNNLTDRLVYQNSETLEFEPWLAAGWTINEIATEYTFTLRDDVTFSAGTPLNAKVVAANFDLYGLGDADRALIVSEAINNSDHSEVIYPTHVKFD